MRPLELTVAGLRSYRTTTTVTFHEDWQLAAIVGLTGAGKSSLLEALVYALFGSGTVPGASQPINLITDDAREMRVVFRFAVGSERFEIARTYRRAGNVQPVLKAAARTYSGAKEVDEAVARVLGLRQDAFCSTVLLPQGRFATLLQAAAGEQKETLDAFFRLGEVTESSSRLVAAAAALAGQRREVEAVREQLPADPAAEVRQATDRVTEAERRRDAADALVAVVGSHEAVAADAASRASAARRRAAELAGTAVAVDEVGTRANGLEALAGEIASAERALAEGVDLASAALRVARQTLSALDAPGVEATAARVSALLERIGEARAAGERAASARAKAERARVDLESIRGDHGRLVEQRDRARVVHEQARLREAEARARFDRLRGLADDAARSARDVEAAEARRVAAARDRDLAQAAEDRARQELTEAAASQATAEDAAATARVALQDSEIRAAESTSRSERLEQLRRGVEDQRSDRDRVVDELTACRLRLDEARVSASQAASAEAAAEGLWRRTQVSLQEALREDAASAAAVGRGPGDPCPVCERELPETFVPPAPSTRTRDAEIAEAAARDELASRRRATTRAEAELENRTEEEASAASRSREVDAALAEGERLLASEGGDEWKRIASAAESARARLEDDRQAAHAASHRLAQARAHRDALARNVEPLAAAAARAAATLATAAAQRDEAAVGRGRAGSDFAGAGGDEALARWRANLETATHALTAAGEPLDATARSASDAEGRLASAGSEAAALGAAAEAALAQSRRAEEAVKAAAAIISAGARQGGDDDPVTTAEAARRWVAARRSLIEAAQQDEIEAAAAVDRAGREVQHLRARRTAELDGPLADAMHAGTRAAAAADVLQPAVSLSPAALAAWAIAASAEIRRQAEDRLREAAAADAAADAAQGAARAACAEIGVAREGLDEWRAAMQREVGAATEAARRATQMAARALLLDRALSASAERARVLGLARDICQGRDSFANHVLVARRQGLIAEAAAILAELSNGRLTFAEDAAATFSVLDSATGAVRDPRLLSGGEQFQASLALALGLVEIAARAGSRIECLFLDEGFGALDAASLDVALDALESAARRGRRIVAVTHVDAVTARADQVLAVAGSESGSRAAWRSAELGFAAR